jgi:hypothetical protein
MLSLHKGSSRAVIALLGLALCLTGCAGLKHKYGVSLGEVAWRRGGGPVLSYNNVPAELIESVAVHVLQHELGLPSTSEYKLTGPFC